jgi:hypothetical protein
MSVICKTDDQKLFKDSVTGEWDGIVNEDWLLSEQKLVKAPLTGERDEYMNEKFDWRTKTEGRFE